MINLKYEMKQEIKCSFVFKNEDFIEQIKCELLNFYDKDTVNNLSFKCVSDNDKVVVHVSSSFEEEKNEQNQPKKRGRKPKNLIKEISFEDDEENEDSNQEEIQESEENVSDETVDEMDITNNEDCKNPTISSIGILDNPENLIIPKVLTYAQYRYLKNKPKHTPLELISLAQFETNPSEVYKALYENGEPPSAIHPDPNADVTTEPTQEEKNQVECFSIKKKISGYKVKIPKFSTNIIDGKKIAFWREVDVEDPSTGLVQVFYKDPHSEEMKELK